MNNSTTINLLLKDNNISAKVKNLQANFTTLNKTVNVVNQTFNSFSTTINNQLDNINFAVVVDMVRNVSNALNNLSSSGASFEQSMANLSSTTGIAGNELADLGRLARETGKSTGVGATNAADAFAQLASQVQVSKIGMEGLKSLQKETITLAQAGGLSMADAATVMASTIGQFGLETTEANRVINVLAAGSRVGSANIAELSQSLKVTGNTASAAGLSVEQTAGALEVLSKNNLKGAEAGTALQDILLKLQTGLGVDLGETGLSTALESLAPKLTDVSYLSKLFGEENLSTAQYLIENATAIDQMTTAMTGTNVAQEQASIRTNTTAERMKQIQSTIDDYKISLFDATGGITAYAAACGDSIVVISQMMPFFALAKSALLSVATATGRATIATTAKTAVEKLATAGTTAWALAQKALNFVMKANPIGLVVTAIAALGSALVVVYNRCESFRNAVNKAWNTMKGLLGIESDTEEQTQALADKTGQLAEETGQLTEKTENLAEGNRKAAGATDQLTESFDNQNNSLRLNLSTLGGIGQKISDLQAMQRNASLEQAIALEKEIKLLEEKEEEMKNALIIGAANKPELKPLEAPPIQGVGTDGRVLNPKKGDNSGKPLVVDSGPLHAITEEVEKAQVKVLSFTESIFGSGSVIGSWADNATAGIRRITDIFGEFGTMLKDDTLNSVQKVSGGLMGMGALMGAMGGIVDGAAGSWLGWGANILAAVAAALPQLLTLFGVQCAVAVSSSATLLPPFNIIAIAATVAGIAAAIASIPKPKAFAAGGIVYGNTFAQVGEYPGAANNPEVIAPLSKLRQLIQPTMDFSHMEFRIRGNDLYAVYNKVNHANTRTR